MKTKLRKIVLIAVFAMLSSTLTYSQELPPGIPQPPDHGQPDDQDAPIGSGIAILLTLGAIYGAKKVYCKKKKD